LPYSLEDAADMVKLHSMVFPNTKSAQFHEENYEIDSEKLIEVRFLVCKFNTTLLNLL
jgi:hypothetical protein